VPADGIHDSFYKLTDKHKQMRAFVYDVLRAEVPKVTLDQLFLAKEKLSKVLKDGVQKQMQQYGIEILATPVTDIDPDQGVKHAMNEINRQERLKKAAEDKGEAAKIIMVKKAEALAQKIRIEAEADADAKELAGEGLSRQRQAIVNGLQESVNLFTKGVPGADHSTVMDMIMITQYFDTMKDIGANSRTNAIFMPHQPGAISDVSSQLRQGILEASFVPPAKEIPQMPTEMSRGGRAGVSMNDIK
jgi:regulator of protease activity HflC (stomatin/prohibitin superfamily)